jgi:hypothetical protein
MGGRLYWLLACCAPLWAHDLAGDVKVQAYLKPEGNVMRVVLRVPLKAVSEAPAKWAASALELYEAGARTGAPTVSATRTSLEADKSFVSFRDALTHVTEAGAGIGNGQLLDVLLEYPVRSAASRFELETGFHKLGKNVVTVLWFMPPEGTIRAFEYSGDPGRIRLDPRWHQAALTFVRLGFFHILDGTDHLLFLFCLVIPFRKLRQLLVIVTSFTVAHSITLICSAFGLAPGEAWFPPLIETLIAASILYMALENIVGVSSVHRRWIITFGFGLVHGFGFSFALHETLQFAGSHLVTSLLAFNVGVELGQILVLAVLVPLLTLLFRYVVAERIGTIILSAFIAHTAWHWAVERWVALKTIL